MEGRHSSLSVEFVWNLVASGLGGEISANVNVDAVQSPPKWCCCSRLSPLVPDLGTRSLAQPPAAAKKTPAFLVQKEQQQLSFGSFDLVFIF